MRSIVVLVNLFVLFFSFSSPAFSENKTVMLPPQLGRTFLEMAYKGNRPSLAYELMSSKFKETVSYKDFKKLNGKRKTGGFATKLKIRLLRQEPLSRNEGVLYYMTEIRPFSFGSSKNRFALEKIKVTLDGKLWKVKEIPSQVIVSDFQQKPTQNDFMVVYHLIEQDRQREISAFAINSAADKSLYSARNLVANGQFRQALMQYHKVLQLRRNDEEALSGVTYCKKQLAQNENAD